MCSTVLRLVSLAQAAAQAEFELLQAARDIPLTSAQRALTLLAERGDEGARRALEAALAGKTLQTDLDPELSRGRGSERPGAPGHGCVTRPSGRSWEPNDGKV